jgi:hypothetical protein
MASSAAFAQGLTARSRVVVSAHLAPDPFVLAVADSLASRLRRERPTWDVLTDSQITIVTMEHVRRGDTLGLSDLIEIGRGLRADVILDVSASRSASVQTVHLVRVPKRASGQADTVESVDALRPYIAARVFVARLPAARMDSLARRP